MKIKIMIRITAIVAILFSILTIIEGSRVLLGITQPDYTVFILLLIYNIVMAVIGLYVGVLIWTNHTQALRNAAIVITLHLIVLIVVIVMFVFDAPISTHSVQAMIIRSAIWLFITIITWKTNQIKLII